MIYSENFLINLLTELDSNTTSNIIDLDDILYHCKIFIQPSSQPLKKAKIIKYLNYFCIIIDINLPSYQYRESLAHEISHVLLNHHSSNKTYDIKEAEANQLAQFLLIPTKKLKQEINKSPHYEDLIIYLSSTFQVSHEFIIKRLELYKKTASCF